MNTKSTPLRSTLARDAFASADVEASKHAHHHHHHHHDHSERHLGSGEYLPDFVLGGIDGVITTFAVVAGVEGASLSSAVILILGIANLVADGLSMALGNYLGAKSEQDYNRSERDRESWEIDNVPEHEREEVMEIYQRKGFSGELLDKVVDQICSNKEQWLETMMRDELDIIEDRRVPWRAGLMTFISFILFGTVPLLVYIYSYLVGLETSTNLFPYCVGATAIALFTVGAARSRVTFRPWFKSGMEILAVGGLAGVLAYIIGDLLKGIGVAG